MRAAVCARRPRTDASPSALDFAGVAHPAPVSPAPDARASSRRRQSGEQERRRAGRRRRPRRRSGHPEIVPSRALAPPGGGQRGPEAVVPASGARDRATSRRRQSAWRGRGSCEQPANPEPVANAPHASRCSSHPRALVARCRGTCSRTAREGSDTTTTCHRRHRLPNRSCPRHRPQRCRNPFRVTALSSASTQRPFRSEAHHQTTPAASPARRRRGVPARTPHLLQRAIPPRRQPPGGEKGGDRR